MYVSVCVVQVCMYVPAWCMWVEYLIIIRLVVVLPSIHAVMGDKHMYLL